MFEICELPDMVCLLMKFMYFMRLVAMLVSILSLECRREGDSSSFYLNPLRVLTKVAVLDLLISDKCVNDLPRICWIRYSWCSSAYFSWLA